MQKTPDLNQLTSQSCEIVAAVAEFIRGETGKVRAADIEDKSWNSLVSYVDKTAEQQLVTQLQKLLPGAVFLTEEGTVEQSQGEFQWIIDPLDGTTNFLHQVPCFSISVALRHRQNSVLGIVYEINLSECFSAWKGGGAFLNGRPIQVSANATLKDSLLATGFPYYDYDRIKAYLRALESFMQTTRGIRRLGSAAVDLAYVACGRFDAFFEYSLNPWDVAAGAFIVQEAGGRVADFAGENNFLFGKEIIAANPAIFGLVSQVIQSEFSISPD
ncbi:MAG: inositol monophosphatase [Bacteroidetes bacterium]|nr:MAG: inositol monophosphatase [Bacteroidota bacterium]